MLDSSFAVAVLSVDDLKTNSLSLSIDNLGGFLSSASLVLLLLHYQDVLVIQFLLLRGYKFLKSKTLPLIAILFFVFGSSGIPACLAISHH